MNIAGTILRSTVLFGMLTVASPPTIGETSTELEPTKDANEAAYKKRSICKKEMVIGTRISKTVCQTAAERDADRAASQEFLKNVQEGAAIQRGSKG